MWKKDEGIPEQPVSAHTPPAVRASPPAREPSRQSGGQPATIGTSITIRGEVSGDEDLLIEGHVDGSVDLGQHSVTVGPAGQVKAGITGRVITVEGTVHGNLRADEMVVLRSTALVDGDITAPRVVLEDGASFRGTVDMGGPETGRARSGNGRPSDAPSPPASPDARTNVAASSGASGKALDAKHGEGKAASAAVDN